MTWLSGPIAITPLGPVACGSMIARVGREMRAVIIVKATFALGAERAAWSVEPTRLFEIDQHRDDDPRKSVVAASDFAPFLPDVGVVVTGSARTTGGAPATTALVGFAIFRDGAALLTKSLHVYGDRKPGRPEPAPFVEMPIVYERTFGGRKTPENPIGVGGDGAPGLPNVVNPNAARSPAGFGPIPPTWEPRRGRLARAAIGAEGLMSTYADNFPWQALHAAPDDQRLHRLRGDEWIVLQGFSATHAQLRSQLPSAHAEARFIRAEEPLASAPIALAADTLAIDADRSTATITWRGHVVITSASDAERLRVFVGLALPNAPVAWPLAIVHPPAHQEEDTTAIGAAAPTAPALPFEPSRHAAVAGPWTQPAAKPGPARASLSGTGDLDLGAMRLPLPFAKAAPMATPPGDAPAPDEGVETAVAVAAPSAVMTSVAKPPGEVRARVVARVKAGDALTGLALAGADLSVLDFTGVDLAGLDLRGADLHATCLERTNLSGAILSGANLAGAKLGGADLSGAALDAADLEGADLSRARLGGASFKGAGIACARLDGVRAEGADFTGARGQNATFRRALLAGANFDDAKLCGADLSGAVFAGATFTNADLDDARLGDGRGDGAAFDGARLARAKLTAASLENASFRLAVAPSSTWDGAVLTGAAFDAANLRDASLYRANAPGASLSDADLRGANLQRITAADACFERAELGRADVRQGSFPGARFDDASLRGARGALADFGGASFVRADLADTVFREARFGEANLSFARLERADLRGANLERAQLEGAALTGANTTGAKTSNPESKTATPK